MAALIARPIRFGDDISYEDRKTLRAVIRRVHGHYFMDHPTNAQCDQLIDALGPATHAKLLKMKLDEDGSLD